jgi:signal peptidase I
MTVDRRPLVRRLAAMALVPIVGALIAAGCGGTRSSSRDVVTFHYLAESMRPTLEPGDRIHVKTRAVCCRRGDIVLFRMPGADTSANPDVKRVLGLPGETVSLPGDGRIYIEGRLVTEPYLDRGAKTMLLPGAVPPGCESSQVPSAGLDCVVPRSAYFVLGDNRPASKDSRFFGPVDDSQIRGVVVDE